MSLLLLLRHSAAASAPAEPVGRLEGGSFTATIEGAGSSVTFIEGGGS